MWADDVEMIIPAAEQLEESLIRFIWRGEEENAKFNQAMVINAERRTRQAARLKRERRVHPVPTQQALGGNEANKVSSTEKTGLTTDYDVEDVEMRALKTYWHERPVMLIAPISDALSVILVMTLIALGLSELDHSVEDEIHWVLCGFLGTLIKEYALDGEVTRFTLLVFAPALFCIASYACMCVVGSVLSTYAASLFVFTLTSMVAQVPNHRAGSTGKSKIQIL